MNTMKKSLTALALAAMLGLTACSTEATKSDAAESPAASESSAAPKEAPSSEPVPSQSSKAPSKAKDIKDELAAFGEEWTYEDGIAVKVTYAGAGMASEYAAGAEDTGGQIRLFDVSITNNSEAIFDPAMFMADINYGAEGTAASRVFDSANGIGDQFQGKILPGGTQTVSMAYAIPTDVPVDLIATITPSWEHEEKLFYGEAVAP